MEGFVQMSLKTYEIGYDEYEHCPKCGQHIDLDSLEQECEDTEDEE